MFFGGDLPTHVFGASPPCLFFILKFQQTQNSKKSGIKSVYPAGKGGPLQDGPQSPEVKGSQSVSSTQSNTTGTSQSDSGGDDSAKENKENSADENQQTPKAKKGLC